MGNKAGSLSEAVFLDRTIESFGMLRETVK